MISKANIIDEYMQLSVEDRIDYICKFYPTFMGQLESFTEGLVYMIEAEQDINRRQSKGDLGVRVQGGQIFSDTTATKAIRNVSLREAIMRCSFEEGDLEDLEHADRYISMAENLKLMRRDYKLFNSQIQALNKEEASILMAYLNKEKNIYDIADEIGYTYESAKQYVRRIRTAVKDNMLSFIQFSFI